MHVLFGLIECCVWNVPTPSPQTHTLPCFCEGDISSLSLTVFSHLFRQEHYAKSVNIDEVRGRGISLHLLRMAMVEKLYIQKRAFLFEVDDCCI